LGDSYVGVGEKRGEVKIHIAARGKEVGAAKHCAGWRGEKRGGALRGAKELSRRARRLCGERTELPSIFIYRTLERGRGVGGSAEGEEGGGGKQEYPHRC
jgi:hypothetical protein